MRSIPTVLALGVVLGGCTILSPVQTRDRFFTLTPVHGAPVGAPATAPGGALVYGLGPITLPAYLDRNEVVTRLSPTEVRYADGDRWAAPLRANVAAVLQQNLSSLLGNPRVVVFPWPTGAPVAYQIEVTFLRFDVDVSGQSQLLARWAIKDPRQDRYVMLRDTSLTRSGPPNDTPAGIVAMSTLLGELSEDIAATLRTLPPPDEAPARAASR